MFTSLTALSFSIRYGMFDNEQRERAQTMPPLCPRLCLLANHKCRPFMARHNVRERIFEPPPFSPSFFCCPSLPFSKDLPLRLPCFAQRAKRCRKSFLPDAVLMEVYFFFFFFRHAIVRQAG